MILDIRRSIAALTATCRQENYMLQFHLHLQLQHRRIASWRRSCRDYVYASIEAHMLEAIWIMEPGYICADFSFNYICMISEEVYTRNQAVKQCLRPTQSRYKRMYNFFETRGRILLGLWMQRRAIYFVCSLRGQLNLFFFVNPVFLFTCARLFLFLGGDICHQCLAGCTH
jgi:hypothetical protein